MVVEEITLIGISASPGIGIGDLNSTKYRDTFIVCHYEIAKEAIPAELDRFHEALNVAKDYYVHLSQKIGTISGQEEAKIFEAHHLMLQDPGLIGGVAQFIEKDQCNAEFAFLSVMKKYIAAISSIDDPYMKERQMDLNDVTNRVLESFTLEASSLKQKPESTSEHLLLAKDLTPSDTANMDRDTVKGFATEKGSYTSHTAILARSLGIPAVVGVADLLDKATESTVAIIDGYEGKVIINPTEATIASYQELIEKKKKIYDAACGLKDFDAVTQDGKKIELLANAEFDHEIPGILDVGVKGIGLFRTEFFLLNPMLMPNEDEQFKLYKKFAEQFEDGVTIRTLDAGGDKLPAETLEAPEPNPFLGWRGIRVSLTRRKWFRSQLKAILRASAFGKVSVMFPMISGVREVDSALAILENCKEALDAEGVEYDKDLKVGCMIEVPSAVLLADHLADKVDFFSIGTNDLIQYTVAVDRINPLVANLYDSSHPGVIKLMDMVVQSARKKEVTTSVCGELAGDINLTPLLLGLGVNELSMSAIQVPLVKKAICSLNYGKCRELALECLKMPYSSDIYDKSRKMAAANYREIL